MSRGSRPRRRSGQGAAARRRVAGARPERGAVTAELAMVLPLLLAVVVAMTWLLSVGLAQVRTVDAAREAARALARGEDEARATSLAVQVAPPGSQVSVGRADGTVIVTVSGTVQGPGGLFGALPGAEVSASATALEEQ